jgi:lysine 2,3-aminomutase
MEKIVTRTIDQLRITPHARKILAKLLKENPELEDLLLGAESADEAAEGIRRMAMEYMADHPHALAFYRFEATGREALEKLEWTDYAAIRILDYLDHAGRTYKDLNLHGKRIANDPFRMFGWP